MFVAQGHSTLIHHIRNGTMPKVEIGLFINEHDPTMFDECDDYKLVFQPIKLESHKWKIHSYNKIKTASTDLIFDNLDIDNFYIIHGYFAWDEFDRLLFSDRFEPMKIFPHDPPGKIKIKISLHCKYKTNYEDMVITNFDEGF